MSNQNEQPSNAEVLAMLDSLKAEVEELRGTSQENQQLRTENESLKRQLERVAPGRPSPEEVARGAEEHLNRSRAPAMAGKYEWVITPSPPGFEDGTGKPLVYAKGLAQRTNTKDPDDALGALNKRLGTKLDRGEVMIQAVGFEPDRPEAIVTSDTESTQKLVTV